MADDFPAALNPVPEREKLLSDFYEFRMRLHQAAYGSNRCTMHVWSADRDTLDGIAALLDVAQGVPILINDEMCEAALAADSHDRIQGFSYNTRHVIRDVWMPPAEQELWSAPVAGPDEYQAFQKQCRIERMRRVLAAALCSLPSTQSGIPRSALAATPEEIAAAKTLIGADLYAWPIGCHSPNSCHRNGRCMYVGCKHDGKDIKALSASAIASTQLCQCSALTRYTDAPHEPPCPLSSTDGGGK